MQKKPVRKPKTTFKRTGRYWFFVENVTYDKKAKDKPAVRLWVALPMDRPGQRIKIGEIVPEPADVMEDPQAGNKVIYWEVKKPEQGSTLTFHYDLEVENRAVKLQAKIDPAKVTLPPVDSPEVKRYTIAEPWLEKIPALEAKAKEIVGTETNPWRQAELVFDWVVKEMTYDYPHVTNRGIKKTFPRLKGDCGEFSHVFIAMMRSLGVPARSVVAVWYQGGGHAWAEIFLPPYGWVPVDTSGAQLVQNGLKGQMGPKKVKSFMRSRGIPKKDPRWLLGNLYPHRLEIFIGENVTFSTKKPEGTRTFQFLQPGGLAGWPQPLKLAGLSKQTVATGFYLWGKGAASEARARKHAEAALGPAYLTAKLYDKAIPALKKTLEKKPKDATTLFQLANAHFQLKQYDEALELFERSIAGKGGSTKRTTDTWARILIGMIHDVKKDRKAAIESYKKAIETGADFAGSLKTAKQFLKKPFRPKPEPKARKGKGKGKRKGKGRWRARRSKRNR